MLIVPVAVVHWKSFLTEILQTFKNDSTKIRSPLCVERNVRLKMLIISESRCCHQFQQYMTLSIKVPPIFWLPSIIL